MKKISLIALVALIIIGLLLANSKFFGRAEIEVTNPIRAEAVQAVYATGTVEPTVMLPISPRSSAKLVELKVDEGDTVHKGQILAQLEDDELQHSIRQLQAREDLAKKEFERQNSLAESKVASKQAYDKAKAELKAASEATRMAQAQASYLKLSAPDDGLIIKRDGEVGQIINTGTPVFWMSCCAPLRISAEVDEEDISQVKIGQKVLIRSDAFSGKIFSGRIQAMTPKGDPIARSYRVRVEFTEETPLQIGMTAETNIIIEEKKDALLVPSSAVTDEKIWVVEEGNVRQKPVTTGIKTVDYKEILEGITESDVVILNPSDSLSDGQNIRPKLVPTSKP